MDPMKTTLEDAIKLLKEKGNKIKDRVTDEADDLKQAWFKHILASTEKMNDKLKDLEERIEELEKHECKCGHDKGNDIRPDMP